jgi:hypothetical protein
MTALLLVEDGIEGGLGRDIPDPPLGGFLRRHGNAVVVVVIVIFVVLLLLLLLLLLADEARRGAPFGAPGGGVAVGRYAVIVV